jgi:hypothetical protein
MLHFLKNLWFYLAYHVPYHEHTWSPLSYSEWGCTYQTKEGKHCTAHETEHTWM